MIEDKTLKLNTVYFLISTSLITRSNGSASPNSPNSKQIYQEKPISQLHTLSSSFYCINHFFLKSFILSKNVKLFLLVLQL